MEYEEEYKNARVAEGSNPLRNEDEEQMLEDHDITKPQRPEELLSEMISCKRRPFWARK